MWPVSRETCFVFFFPWWVGNPATCPSVLISLARSHSLWCHSEISWEQDNGWRNNKKNQFFKVWVIFNIEIFGQSLNREDNMFCFEGAFSGGRCYPKWYFHWGKKDGYRVLTLNMWLIVFSVTWLPVCAGRLNHGFMRTINISS